MWVSISVLFLIFLIILYVNDLRIRYNSLELSRVSEGTQKPDQKRIRLQLNIILGLLLGALWFTFYEIFELLKVDFNEESLIRLKLTSLFTMVALFMVLKFVFKRKILNSSF